MIHDMKCADAVLTLLYCTIAGVLDSACIGAQYWGRFNDVLNLWDCV